MIKTWKKNIFSNKKLENIKENQVELKNIITETLKYNGLPCYNVSSLNNGREDLMYFSYKHFTYFFIQKSQQDHISSE